ncbi:LAETG motif-containing sortase-dependent surface protein [Actinacidiphila acidipaludis]|uniref:LPXTG cell wall anchor domain-containing protein n=1 Tax=Actinacidiphila acidipaludis TaxID=2873382 RepID=A0ABS7Q3U4_9ACTN|nr:LAETG motif-containing sortase-dependent surface protein [Streptomyces acidipaludis]MBY8877623.1 LPXTG cell wall anchor domain-containing protein [Streptomyces acidipaludis]
MPAITKRATGLAIAVGTFTAAMSFACLGTAQADDGCPDMGIEHSLDGGQTWLTDGRMDGEKIPTVVDVRLEDSPVEGCKYHVSLASYSAEGPDWGSSGTQAFLGWDTVTLQTGKTQATLDVSDHAPDCYGQIDLYNSKIKYDGGTGKGHGPLPHYYNSPTPYKLITAWNGGHKCDTTTPPTTPTDTPTTDTPTPSDTPTTDTPTPSDTPTTDTPTPSDTPTTDTPTPTATTTAPAVGDTSSPAPSSGSTAPPTGTATVAADDSGSNLAETGGNGTQTTAFAVGGAVLLLGGGAAVYFTRRRNSGAH